jgi:acetylglutamate kinase
MVERLLRDVVFLEAVGINPVLIHGGGKAITDRLRQMGIKARFVNGLRVTDEPSIRVVEETLDGAINPKIVASINEFGGKAAGFSGKLVFKARRLPPQLNEQKKEMVDMGFVGEVVDLDLAEVKKVIARETVPVISPIAQGEAEEALNVNADIAAGAIAGALKASKLIYLSDVPGLMRDPAQKDSLIPSVNREEIRMLMEEKIIEGGMVPKTESAVRALGSGVSKVHFIDGRIPHALLLEIFTNTGIGTEIVP